MERSSLQGFRTEVAFELPLGLVDESGVRHRKGVMRFATAADEILPMRDPRVQANPAYISIIILARVVTKLGALPDIDTHVVEQLFTADFEYLRELYEKINSSDDPNLADLAPAYSSSNLSSTKLNGKAGGGPPMLGEA
jgi:hypothetical protein